MSKKRGEEAKVAVRNIRRDANDFVKKQNKAGDLNDDQAKDEEDKVQKMTDKYIKQIDEAVDAKIKRNHDSLILIINRVEISALFCFMWKETKVIYDTQEVQMENLNIPQHVAIILDGNGRWAKNAIYLGIWDIDRK